MSEIFNETKYLMNKYKIKANKNIGQNFLVDSESLEDIVKCAEVTDEDLVIEIGPGLGTLTKLLLERARKVICIELDKKMVKILKDRFIAYENLIIINEDVLKIDLENLIKSEKERGIKTVKIVANLPYYITTPIIMMLIENHLDIESITVMIQKEVAERLIAIPGTKLSGAITYTVYYYCRAQKIREVENTSFVPQPEVTSEVINLKLRKEPPVQVRDKKVMFNMIKCAYMQRRKTLINSLVSVGIFESKESGIEILKKLGLKQDVRAENLTLEDFARLTDYFLNNL